MAEAQEETQQQKEARWAANRAKQYPEQQTRRTATAKARGRNWVGGLKRRWWALVEALRKRLPG